MDLSPNPKVDPSETSPFTFGGVEFRIAKLVLRQTSRIGPLVADVVSIQNRRAAAFRDHPNATQAVIAISNGTEPPEVSEEESKSFFNAMALSEPDSDVLITVVHVGLTRVHPRLTIDDLLDLPVVSGDLVNAASRILDMSGLIERKTKTPGEAEATSP